MNHSDPAYDSFRFGDRDASVVELVGISELNRLQKKFTNHSPRQIVIGLRELSRYLYLVGKSGHSLFFPGNRLIDELWHSLITETAAYRIYCSNIQLNTFFEHSGIKFHDYIDLNGQQETQLEQLSWLSSYINAFGELDEDSFGMLELAKDLSEKLQLDRSGLNKFGFELLEVSKLSLPSVRSYKSIQDYCNSHIELIANKLDSDAELVGREIKNILSLKALLESKHEAILNNQELEAIFGSSVCLGFSIWQHLAAVERLSGLNDWQIRNADLWADIKSGKKTCGLATTHLAKKGGSPLNGIETLDGFVIRGEAPWVSGIEYFEKLIVGFETAEEIVFALIDFPKAALSEPSLKVEPLQLSSMNGTATGKLSFIDFKIPTYSLISRRSSSTPASPRVTGYKMPELGIAKAAVGRLRTRLETQRSPEIFKALELLQARLDKVDISRHSSDESINFPFEMSEIVRDSLRLLALAEGGSALKGESFVSRTLLNTMLLDAVFQSPATLSLKLQKITGCA